MFCQRGLLPAEYLHLSSACDPTVTAAALDGRDLGPKISAPNGPQSSHRWSRAKEQEAYRPALCLLEQASLEAVTLEFKSHI